MIQDRSGSEAVDERQSPGSLMPGAALFDAAAATDPGWKFKENQDAVLLGGQVWSETGVRMAAGCTDLLVGVADGVAFPPCASRASLTVLELLAGEVVAAGRLAPSAPRAIQRRMTEQVAGTRCEGMPSTLAAVHFCSEGVRVVSVGDSRVYPWRNGQMRQITVDHTVARRMVLEGDLTEEEASRVGSIYTDLDSALSASDLEDHFEIFSCLETARPGDRWLCCSDGITHALSDADLTALLAAEPEATVDFQVRSIVGAAKTNRCSDDNVSVIVVQVRMGPTPG